jgi:hypothetical protein
MLGIIVLLEYVNESATFELGGHEITGFRSNIPTNVII